MSFHVVWAKALGLLREAELAIRFPHRVKDPAKRTALADKLHVFVDHDTHLDVKRVDVDGALDLARRFGGIDGSDHKAWVIDQMVRKLLGSEYEAWVKEACDGEDGPQTYEWDEGIAP